MITITTVERKDLHADYHDMMKTETHHDHEIIMSNDVVRWRKNLDVDRVQQNLNLNDLTRLFELLGHGKNSEVYRKLYRDLGVSLHMYWEVFYWEVNNELAHEYKQPKKIKV